MKPALLLLVSGAVLCGVRTPPGAAAERGFAYDAYAAVLQRYVDDTGMVDYKALKANRAGLDTFVKRLGDLDRTTYEAWNAKAKIAFWINAYNGLTLKTIINHYPIQASWWRSLRYPKNSIRQISGVWDEITHEVMGKKMTLEAIEHETLRKDFDEPRIHLAIVCAAMGCPPLRNEPYLGGKLDAQFAHQARRFFSNAKTFRIERDGGEVYLSPIFKWFGEDFVPAYVPEEGFGDRGKTLRAVLNYVAEHLRKKDAEYLRTGEYDVEYLDYDWTLNAQSEARDDAGS